MDAPILPSKWESHLKFLNSSTSTFHIKDLESHIPALFHAAVQSPSTLHQLTILLQKRVEDITQSESLDHISYAINLLRPGLVPDRVPFIIPENKPNLDSYSFSQFFEMKKNIESIGHWILKDEDFRKKYQVYIENYFTNTLFDEEACSTITLYAQLCSAIDKIDPKFLPANIKEFATGKQTLTFANGQSLSIRNYRLVLIDHDSTDLKPLTNLTPALFNKMITDIYTTELHPGRHLIEYQYGELFDLIACALASNNQRLLDFCLLKLDEKSDHDRDQLLGLYEYQDYEKAFDLCKKTGNKYLKWHLESVLENHKNRFSRIQLLQDTYILPGLVNQLPKELLAVLNNLLTSVNISNTTWELLSGLDKLITLIKALHTASDKLDQPRDYKPVADLIKTALATETKELSLSSLKTIKDNFPELVLNKSGDILEEEGDEFVSLGTPTGKGQPFIKLDLSNLSETELDLEKFGCLAGMNIQEITFSESYKVLRQIEPLFPALIVIKKETWTQRAKNRAYALWTSRLVNKKDS